MRYSFKLKQILRDEKEQKTSCVTNKHFLYLYFCFIFFSLPYGFSFQCAWCFFQNCSCRPACCFFFLPCSNWRSHKMKEATQLPISYLFRKLFLALLFSELQSIFGNSKKISPSKTTFDKNPPRKFCTQSCVPYLLINFFRKPQNHTLAFVSFLRMIENSSRDLAKTTHSQHKKPKIQGLFTSC